jgi:hypothetical protein
MRYMIAFGRFWYDFLIGDRGYVIAFGRFWYDFLIGDRPELFFGPILALVFVAQLVGAGWTTTGGLVLFVLVVASGGGALARELAEARARSDG